MFSKLLKYDFKAMKRFGFPILLGIAGAGVLGMLDAFVVRRVTGGLASEEEINVGTVLLTMGSTMFLFLLISMLFVAFTAITVMTYVNFYRSLVTDEGYLTFTLPVRVADIIRSKLLNGFLWMTSVALAILAALALILIPFGVWQELPALVRDMLPVAKTAPLLIVLYVILIPTAAVNSMLLYFMAIFFGSVIAKKNKLVAAVACVLGVHFVYGIGSGIVSIIASLFFGTVSLLAEDPQIGMCFLVGFYIAVLTAMNVLFYHLLKHMMEKRLNLA